MNPESTDKLQLSLERAVKFIKDNRNRDGLWSDFRTLAGESVYWVSGYVGYTLSSSDVMSDGGVEAQRDWLKKIGNNILEHQNKDGGWGYGPGVPSDADSTSWCLLFLTRIGIQESESRDKALLFLSKHQSPLDGGFRTYAMPRKVGRYMMLDESVSFDGWASSHMCVTGVAVQALIETSSPRGINQALECIRKNQTTGGYWNPYWWSDKLYSTINCMKVLKSQVRGEEDDRILTRAQEWIAKTQLSDGGWSDDYLATESAPFSTALGLRGLVMAPSGSFSEKIGSGVKWLLAHQQSDGSWNSRYMLRIPHPSMKEPWNQTSWKEGGMAINALIKDHRRLYTTATVLKALSEVKQFSRGEME